MKVNVYHRINSRFVDEPAKAMAELQLVATLEQSAAGSLLDAAWERTNSIDAPWTSSPGAGLTVHAAPCRSTSVGDVMQVVNGDAVDWFVCARLGFDRIEEPR